MRDKAPEFEGLFWYVDGEGAMEARIKVLMAEDEPDVLAIMAKSAVKEGYDVVTAIDGEDALAKIRKEVPDVIVLDLNMPKLDGFSVLESIRKQPPADKWIPVIIVSARNELAQMQRGIQLEADHYLTKPCRVDEVIKAIKLMVNLIPQRRTEE